jgi:hypothetical protein
MFSWLYNLFGYVEIKQDPIVEEKKVKYTTENVKTNFYVSQEQLMEAFNKMKNKKASIKIERKYNTFTHNNSDNLRKEIEEIKNPRLFFDNIKKKKRNDENVNQKDKIKSFLEKVSNEKKKLDEIKTILNNPKLRRENKDVINDFFLRKI